MIKGAADFLVTDVVILGIFVIAAAAIAMEIALLARLASGPSIGVAHVGSPEAGHDQAPLRSAAPPPPVGVKYHHATEADGWLYVTGQFPADPQSPPRLFHWASRLKASRHSEPRDHRRGGRLCVFKRGVRPHLSDAFQRDYDGFNDVYHHYFADEEHVPSRTTIGVAKLGRDALVEVDLVLYRRATT